MGNEDSPFRIPVSNLPNQYFFEKIHDMRQQMANASGINDDMLVRAVVCTVEDRWQDASGLYCVRRHHATGEVDILANGVQILKMPAPAREIFEAIRIRETLHATTGKT